MQRPPSHLFPAGINILAKARGGRVGEEAIPDCRDGFSRKGTTRLSHLARGSRPVRGRTDDAGDLGGAARAPYSNTSVQRAVSELACLAGCRGGEKKGCDVCLCGEGALHPVAMAGRYSWHSVRLQTTLPVSTAEPSMSARLLAIASTWHHDTSPSVGPSRVWKRMEHLASHSLGSSTHLPARQLASSAGTHSLLLDCQPVLRNALLT